MTPRIATLRHPVKVGFDRWGVPHVTARTRDDLYRVEGFLHATSRGWQMELTARAARGATAEILGVDAYPFDVRVRRLGIPAAARAAASRLSAQDLAILEPYAEGVLAARASTGLTPEHRALGIEPARSDDVGDVLVDVCGSALIRALALSDSWRRRLARAWLAAEEESVGRLAGGHGAGGEGADVEWLRAAWTAFQHPAAGDVDSGSNAFAVAGWRAASGSPLLAGDPHLRAEAPGAWMEMHLRCPDLHVTGGTLPGVPNVLAGRNERIAWAITSSQADVADCYLERIDRATDTFLSPGGWRPLRRRTETVAVRGAPDRVLHVEETRNGPILHTSADGSQAVTLRWIHTEVAGRQRAIEAMNEADSWPEFREALATYSGVGLGIIYADVDGVIARQQIGTVPRRASGRPEARILAGWSGADDWRGVLPFDAMAGEVDPPSGVVCAANDDPGVGSEATGLDWDWSGRADRARALLGERTRISREDLLAVQLDLHSPMAAQLRPVLLAAAPDASTAAALHCVTAWDLRYASDSMGAAVFERWYPALVRQLLPGHVSADLVEATIEIRTWWSASGVQIVMNRIGALPAAELTEASTRALRRAVAELEEQLGPAPWTYGRLSSTSYQHVLGPAFSIGPFAFPGGVDSLCRGDGRGLGRGVPTLRQISDLADPDAGLASVSTGNSGVPGDPHFGDQVDDFREGRLHPWPMSTRATDALVEHTVTLGAEPDHGGST